MQQYRSSNTLQSLQSEVNRLFENLFPRSGGEQQVERAGWSPQIDVLEADNHYRLRLDLPGVERDDVTINAEGQRLIIRGARPEPERQDNENLVRTERMHGRFYRAMSFPSEVNPDKAKATFQNGVLTVNLPKVKKSTAKSIAIS